LKHRLSPAAYRELVRWFRNPYALGAWDRCMTAVQKGYPHEPLELVDPSVSDTKLRTKQRRLHKLRSRNGKCLTCQQLIVECQCLATIVEYMSIEAGNIHLTRKRRESSVALDKDYWEMMAELDERIWACRTPDDGLPPYFGSF
jgi:hypothetical protein